MSKCVQASPRLPLWTASFSGYLQDDAERRRRNQLHIHSRPAGAQTELFLSAQASHLGLETPTTPTPYPHLTCPKTLNLDTSSLARLSSYSRQRHRPHPLSCWELLCGAGSIVSHLHRRICWTILTHVNHCRNSNTVCMRQPCLSATSSY